MKNEYPYPVETLKHWYVTIVGGQSCDLKPTQIGVNKEALAENTNIVPYEDNVLISKLEGKGMPLFTKKYFTVVPLDEASADASSKSPKGEVVLPVQDNDRKHGNQIEQFKVGKPVILNNVLSQRYSFGFVHALDRLIKRRSERPYIRFGAN
jgi:hypothetical protein